MSRKRDLSSDISHDARIAELSECENGHLAVALYMMAIPQADDWGRLPGNPRELKMLVCPGFDTPKQQIDAAISDIARLGLWDRYEVNGKCYVAFPPESWFKRQSYINSSKRTDDTGSMYPANQQFVDYAAAQSAEKDTTDEPSGKKQQATAEKDTTDEPSGKKQHYARVSPSPSPSPSPSLSEKAKDVVPTEQGAGEGLATGRDAVKVFIDKFAAKTGKPPDLPARYAKGLKEALGRVGYETLTRGIDGFLADAWASESGFSVSCFLSQPMDRWTGAKPGGGKNGNRGKNGNSGISSGRTSDFINGISHPNIIPDGKGGYQTRGGYALTVEQIERGWANELP